MSTRLVNKLCRVKGYSLRKPKDDDDRPVEVITVEESTKPTSGAKPADGLRKFKSEMARNNKKYVKF